jgi:hypothetical protein
MVRLIYNLLIGVVIIVSAVVTAPVILFWHMVFNIFAPVDTDV